MYDVLQKIADKSNKVIPQEEGDYIKDGLLYCGKCNTPKQGKYPIGNGKFLMPRILCDCETQKRDREQEEIEKEKRFKRLTYFRNIGIHDDKLLRYSFDVDKMPESKQSQAFRRYCDKWQEMKEKNIGLLFLGGVGTGKTFYSSCIVNEIIKRYSTLAIATSIPRILNTIFSCEDKNFYIERLANVPLLAIDDLGAERGTDYALEQVYTVIDERYKANKPLIVTTNLSIEELKNPSDIRLKRIYDRILEMCVPFKIEGVSMREANAKQKVQDVKNMLFG